MDGFLDKYYAINVANDLVGATVIVVGWVLLGAHLFPDRWAPWAWLSANMWVAGVHSIPIVGVALVRGDTAIAGYHLLWVGPGLVLAFYSGRRMLRITGPRYTAWRQRRQIAAAHRRIAATHPGPAGPVVPGEVIDPAGSD